MVISVYCTVQSLGCTVKYSLGAGWGLTRPSVQTAGSTAFSVFCTGAVQYSTWWAGCNSEWPLFILPLLYRFIRYVQCTSEYKATLYGGVTLGLSFYIDFNCN